MDFITRNWFKVLVLLLLALILFALFEVRNYAKKAASVDFDYSYISQILDNTERAADNAEEAYVYAKEAAEYAADASSYAADAVEYASEAAENAADASRYASSADSNTMFCVTTADLMMFCQ